MKWHERLYMAGKKIKKGTLCYIDPKNTIIYPVEITMKKTKKNKGAI